MKLVLIGTVPVFLLLGAIAPAYAQPNQDKQEQDKSDRRRDKPSPAPQGQPRQDDHRAQPPQQQRQDQRSQQPQQQQPDQQRQQQRAQQPPQQQPDQQRQQQRAQQPPLYQDQQRQPQRQQAQQPQRAQQQPPQRNEQQAQAWQQQRGWTQRGGWQEHATWQQDRSSHWQTDHRTWGERGGYGGYYIPDDRFSLYFGTQHMFRISSRPIIMMGYPRFQYGGFSFLLVDPWPEYWPEDWYSRDDVYIDYNNGYYLYNRRDPGVALAITVVL
jgi:hypothetical protein